MTHEIYKKEIWREKEREKSIDSKNNVQIERVCVNVRKKENGRERRKREREIHYGHNNNNNNYNKKKDQKVIYMIISFVLVDRKSLVLVVDLKKLDK